MYFDKRFEDLSDDQLRDSIEFSVDPLICAAMVVELDYRLNRS